MGGTQGDELPTLVLSDASFALKLLTFFYRCRATLIQVSREIIEVYPLRTFLRSFHADERQGDVAGRYLADELIGRKSEEALRNFVGRYDWSAGVHRHQQESRVHGVTLRS